MYNFSQLKILIQNSNLAPVEIDDLISFFRSADDENLGPLIELFEERPEWILKINQNIKNKKRAWKNADRRDWDAITDEEIRELLKIDIENA